MSTENANIFNRPMTKAEEKEVVKTGAILVVSSLLFMSVFALLVHFETIRLYPSTMNVDMVKGYAGRVEFTLRYQTLLVSWLLFAILNTIYGRLTNMAINPLDETKEPIVQSRKNILTNSLEQIVLSLFSQLIFVSFASPEAILKVIPLVNIIQFVGRITFQIGYPLKRAFGFQCSQLPTIFLVLYNLYKFFAFLVGYWITKITLIKRARSLVATPNGLARPIYPILLTGSCGLVLHGLTGQPVVTLKEQTNKQVSYIEYYIYIYIAEIELKAIINTDSFYVSKYNDV